MATAGCGDDDFANDPRPPLQVEIGITVGKGRITVSPAVFGAGPANFTVLNLEGVPATVEIDGPVAITSTEAPARGGTGGAKAVMVPGDYEASAVGVDAVPFEFEVGPERPSAQDELLIP
jgi:hypothetical protein